MLFERNGWKIFTIKEIDVSVSFWFLVIMGFIAVQSSMGWLLAIAIALSVLIHEFGHAIPSKMWRLSPSILLHGFGGLCFHEPAQTDAKDIAIVVAGPLLEIAVGLIAFALVGFVPNELLRTFVFYFAYVSIAWGLFNLLVPIYPLDGGKLLLLILRRVMKEERAQELTMYVSLGLAVLMIPAGFYFGFWFIAFLGFFIALDNWNVIQHGHAVIDRKAKVRTSDFVKNTLRDVEVAFDDEDFREAARLCHVLRSGNEDIPPKQMARVWEVLTISATQMGEYEEALGWLKRAPDTAAVRAAKETIDENLPS